MSLSGKHPLGLKHSDFPARDHLIYLNHAGTAPITGPAATAMKQFAEECANHGSAAYSGWTAGAKATRASAARLLGAASEEIAFTKSTTQGLNLVALGIGWKPGDIIVAEEKTFPANWLPWKMAVNRGATVAVWPERNYRYELEDLEALLKKGNVRMVAATSANFATGFRQDMEAVGHLCRKYGALHCVDGIQTLGVHPLDVKRCNIDFLAADSHKWLMGPEGSAIFYVSRDCIPLIHEDLVGWMGRQRYWEFDRLDLPPDPTARRFEEGSPNIAGILAMGASLDLILKTGVENIFPHNRSLCRRLEGHLENNGWEIVTPREDQRAASIVSARKDGTEPHEAVRELWERAKAFCVARRGFLRLSPHFYQTVEHMDRVGEALRGL